MTYAILLLVRHAGAHAGQKICQRDSEQLRGGTGGDGQRACPCVKEWTMECIKKL